jgi:hypothetical protein
VVAAQPDFEAETIWKRWRQRGLPGVFWFHLTAGLPKAIG